MSLATDFILPWAPGANATEDGDGYLGPSALLAAANAARTHFERRAGITPPLLQAALGGSLRTRRSQTQAFAPVSQAMLGLRLAAQAEKLGDEAGVRFTLDVLQGAALVGQAEIHTEWTGAAPMPEALLNLLPAAQTGAPLIDVQVGDWARLGPDASRVRTTVFVREQGIPEELEWDAADATCTHAVAYNRLGQALGTGRLLEHVPGVAKIGRMAALASVRGGGVGRAVLNALMQAARARGDREAVLHAQVSAAAFYERAGFSARGPVFEEAGIDHVEMVCQL